MTELLITPNYDKKTAKFKGTVAAGESVSVKIANAVDVDTENLRLRVMDFNGRTLAMFKRGFTVIDEVEVDWYDDGEYLTCTLDLNTVEMQSAVCGMCERELLVVLDDPESGILYFKGECEFQGWPKREGEDIPYDLGEYPDVVEDLKTRVNEAESAVLKAQSDIAGAVDKATGIVKTASEAQNAAELALKAAVDAKDVAAQSAQDSGTAAAAAKSAARDAIDAKEAAESARSDTDNVLGEMVNIRDDFLNSCYTKEEVNSLIEGAKGKRIIVQELPAVGEDNNIYMVEKSGGDGEDWYDEYMWIYSHWERIGSTNINANSFATKEELNAVGHIAQGASDGASAAIGEVNKLQGTVEQKRDKTDNIATKDETVFSEWEFHCSDPTVQDALKRSGELYFENGVWYLSADSIDGYSGPEEGIIEGAHDATSLVFPRAYISENGYVEITATRSISQVTKSGEPYVTPTGVKALVPKTELHAITPETTDDKVTLKPVDGKANWVDGTVGIKGEVVREYEVPYAIYIAYMYISDDGEEEDLVYFHMAGVLNSDNTILNIDRDGEYDAYGEFTTTKAVTLENTTGFSDVMTSIIIPEGVRIGAYFANIPYDCDNLNECSFESEEAEIFAPDNIDDLTPNVIEINGRSYWRDLYESTTPTFRQTVTREGKEIYITLPESTGPARSFSLALTTDAESETEVTWQGVEVIETVPGASKLVPGLTVWDVAEVAPGKFKVERASSPAQSAPLTLTAPNGRVAELTVGDDLVLEVKEK